MKFTKRGAQKIIVRRNEYPKKIETYFVAKKDPDYSIEFHEFQKLIELIKDFKDELISLFLGAPKR